MFRSRMQLTQKYLVLILLLLLINSGCEEKEIPYQISDEQFVLVLTDLHVSESATQHLSLSMRDSMAKVYLKQVLEMHQVPNELFTEDYNRLKRDPTKLKIIYDLIIKRLNDLKLKKEQGESTR